MASDRKGLILIVDDEVRHVESLAEMAATWGYEVLTASDGAKAAGLLITNDIDVILLDLHMPVADGHKVMKFIKKRNLTTRVIAISGDPSLDDAIKSINQGVDSFLRKPLSPIDLVKAIDKSLKTRKTEKEKASLKRMQTKTGHLHRLMFDISPLLMFFLDAKGNFRLVNNLLCKVTGYSKKDIIGKHWSILVEEDEVDRIHHVFEERRDSPEKFPELEVRLKCRATTDKTDNPSPRTILVALQSVRLYSRGENTKVFLGIYGLARDITQDNKLQELNQYEEFLDNLTCLPNRVLFEDYLSFAINQSIHEQTSFSLIFVYLDDLKQINEHYGHHAGDVYVQTVAARLKKQVRKGDTVARIDGSEFVLLLPHVHKQASIANLNEKIKQSIEKPITAEGKTITVSVSMGLAVYPLDGESAEKLIDHARRTHNVVYHPGASTKKTRSSWVKLSKSELNS